MDGPDERDVRRAFLKALNESGTRYLLIGDLARVKLQGPFPATTSEAWIDPTTSDHAAIKIHTQTYWKLQDAFPNAEEFQLLERLDKEVKLYRERPPLNFETSYAMRVGATLYGERTSVVCADHWVALKLDEAIEASRGFGSKAEIAAARHEVNAREMLKFARTEEQATEHRKSLDHRQDGLRPKPTLRVIDPKIDL